MIRYFLHIAYSGTNYRGWQKQANVISIQELFERRLEQVFKYKISCLGCGRTDAGVHASQYFFHIDVKAEIDFDLKFRLNKMLPADIVVYDIIKMERDYHAQFDAKSRTYDYYIHASTDPFLANLSSFYSFENLDLERVKKATRILMRYTDYRAFCKTPDRHDSTICNIKSVKWFIDDPGQKLRFQITSNKFLKSMIRILVFKLMEVGKGKMGVDKFEYYLSEKVTPQYNNLAYPQGLYLSKIEYPFLNIEPRADLFSFVQKNTNNYWQEI